MGTQAPPISSVMIVGSGVMGRAIAQVFAAAGLETVIYRHTPKEGLALPDGVRLTTTLPDAAPDLIIESVYEILDLKVEVLRRMEDAYGDDAILASNTSGLSLDDMAAALRRPERFLGMHYFMPAEVSPLVEVVRVAQTADGVVDRVVAVLERCHRQALLVSQPIVGYLWNRLQHAILHEAYHLIETGVVTAEDVDQVAKRLLGPRFCVTGLIESKDIGGLGTHVLAQHAIVPHLHAGRTPSAILDRKVERGELGIGTGKGFYDWHGRDAETVSAAARRKLSRLNAFLEEEMNAGEADLTPGPSVASNCLKPKTGKETS